MGFGKFRGWLRRHPRHKIFFWTTLIGLIFGAIEFGHPLESVLQVVRDRVRSQPASGEIVVVAIDDRSIAEVGQWPWPRSHHATLVRNLDALVPEKIILDVEFSSPSRPTEDQALASAFASLQKPATVAVRHVQDPMSQVVMDQRPIPAIRAETEQASINLYYNYEGFVWWLPYSVRHGPRLYSSLSAALAGRTVPLDTTDYRVDYSVDPASVPTVSAVDVLRGRVPRSAIEGKRVVVGATSIQLGDTYLAPGHKRIPGVYLHVFGAETLRRGTPLEIGWLPPFIAAILLVAAALGGGGRRIAIAMLGLGIAVTLALPLYLDSVLIFTTTMPALFVQISAAIALAWTNLREGWRQRASINPISGMPNLTALRADPSGHLRPLIAAKIRNYSEIVSTLSRDEEKALVAQIAGRLSVTESDPTIYQSDDGVFAWFADAGIVGVIEEYLDALHTLFRSPVTVAEAKVDLSVTFGVETNCDRDLANRLGSALAAADDAAANSLRWKRYDPAGLKEARWKLSLLSQLDAAIDDGDLWLAFQPKVTLPSGRMVGAEALVRWTHPDKGEISPMEFVLAAEQSGRIDRLTAFVLDRAIAAAAEINASGTPFGIAVNISARMISDSRLAGTVAQALDRYRFDPALLTLEVTETAALSYSESATASLQTMRDMGVQISIDDYGTGLSTLEYLKKIPATEIKIDKTFVQAVNDSRSDRLMVHSTIQLAHSLGQKVVAEGIEDAQTLQALIRMGCDFAQGYHTGKPMPFQLLKKRVEEWKNERAA